MRNAIGAAFGGLFGGTEGILRAKGAAGGAGVYEHAVAGPGGVAGRVSGVRSAVPGTRLKVFSSLQVYQVSGSKDREAYGALYEAGAGMGGGGVRGVGVAGGAGAEGDGRRWRIRVRLRRRSRGLR